MSQKIVECRNIVFSYLKLALHTYISIILHYLQLWLRSYHTLPPTTLTFKHCFRNTHNLQFLPIRLTLKYCFPPDSHSDIASCNTHIYTLSSARLTFKQCLHLYITSHISCTYILAPAILHSGHSFIQMQKNFIETKENFDQKPHSEVKTPVLIYLSSEKICSCKKDYQRR